MQMVRISPRFHGRVVRARDARARRAARGGAQLARGDGGGARRAHAARAQRGAAARPGGHGRR